MEDVCRGEGVPKHHVRWSSVRRWRRMRQENRCSHRRENAPLYAIHILLFIYRRNSMKLKYIWSRNFDWTANTYAVLPPECCWLEWIHCKLCQKFTCNYIAARSCRRSGKIIEKPRVSGAAAPRRGRPDVCHHWNSNVVFHCRTATDANVLLFARHASDRNLHWLSFAEYFCFSVAGIHVRCDPKKKNFVKWCSPALVWRSPKSNEIQTFSPSGNKLQRFFFFFFARITYIKVCKNYLIHSKRSMHLNFSMAVTATTKRIDILAGRGHRQRIQWNCAPKYAFLLAKCAKIPIINNGEKQTFQNHTLLCKTNTSKATRHDSHTRILLRVFPFSLLFCDLC